MKKSVRKSFSILSIVLAVVLAALILAAAASTALSNIYDVAQVGNTAFCLINKGNHTTVIFGFGRLWNYAGSAYSGSPPRSRSPLYASGTKKVIICYGITNISHRFFSDCIELSDIYIPASVSELDSCAFLGRSSLARVHFEGDAPQFVCLGKKTLPDGNFVPNPFESLYMDTNPSMIIYHQSGAKGWNSSDWSRYRVYSIKYFIWRIW